MCVYWCVCARLCDCVRECVFAGVCVFMCVCQFARLCFLCVFPCASHCGFVCVVECEWLFACNVVCAPVCSCSLRDRLCVFVMFL